MGENKDLSEAEKEMIIKVLQNGQSIEQYYEVYKKEELDQLKEKERMPHGLWDKDLGSIDMTVNWIIDRYFNDSSISVIAGKSRSYKSFLSLYMSVCIAGGLKFLGFIPVRKSTVFYVDTENSIEWIKEKVEAIKNGLGIKEPLPIFYCSIEGFMIDNDKDYESLKFFVEKHNPTVVFLDLFSMAVQIEENKAEDLYRIFNERLRPIIKRKNVALVLLHHLRKSLNNRFSQDIDVLDEMRGSSVLANSADNIIVTKLDPQNGNCFIMSHNKCRRAQVNPPLRIQVTWETGTDIATFESLGEANISETQIAECAEALLGWFELNPQETKTKFIIEALTKQGYTQKTISRALKILIDRQDVLRPKRGIYKFSKERQLRIDY